MIEEWLTQKIYRTLQNSDQDSRVLILRTLEEWRNLAHEIEARDQSLHGRLATELRGKRLQSAWLGITKEDCEPDLQESPEGHFRGLRINCQGLSSSDRAILEVLECYISRRTRGNTKVLIAEPFSELSLQIRGKIPRAIATAYSPEKPDRFFPLMHLDLHSIPFSDSSFDIVITSEVFEHLADYKTALNEVSRVLVSGGVHIFTCPFHWESDSTDHRAFITDGKIVNIKEPEYHGDPLRPSDGALVFQIPGWDIIEILRGAGFVDSCACYLSSAKAGIVGNHISGCFVFIAQK
jgi:hypothetical protein